MARTVFLQTSGQSGTGYDDSDPVAIVEDGEEVGFLVDPATNPSSPFVVVSTPGTPKADLVYSLETAYGPEAPPVSGSSLGGFREILMKRTHTMDPNQLPPAQRTQWNSGDDFILSEAEYIAAVVLK